MLLSPVISVLINTSWRVKTISLFNLCSDWLCAFNRVLSLILISVNWMWMRNTLDNFNCKRDNRWCRFLFDVTACTGTEEDYNWRTFSLKFKVQKSGKKSFDEKKHHKFSSINLNDFQISQLLQFHSGRDLKLSE